MDTNDQDKTCIFLEPLYSPPFGDEVLMPFFNWQTGEFEWGWSQRFYTYSEPDDEDVDDNG